ncbi:hypothetical protein K6119_08055 [Paracrocinitomix mangrovi]|uniref:hypothetical protein n=1 Tax=Paracrocinitomix mangrovi TaxID=2862509 RepID=UPI001C8E8955|nr:hypothetical protein [Paracrocinitomix mangrovi]UKN03465.1 hypothetical protein K6119_08055 [Paracrocinitomix mangrovi]
MRNYVILIALAVITTACPGPCVYEEKTVDAYVSFFELENDEVTFVTFKPVEKNQNSSAWETDATNKKTWVDLNREEMTELEIDFSKEIAQDTTIIYEVTGSFITEGTCSPSSISKIKRLKN